MSPAGARSIFSAMAIVAVAAAIGGGLYLLGSPSEERVRKMDERRISDLQRLQLAIDLYWTRQAQLPASLDELARDAGTGIYSRDPAVERAYEYHVKDARAYELCAIFDRPSSGAEGFWSHRLGRQCFQVAARRIQP